MTNSNYEKQLAYSIFSSICDLLEGISKLSQANILITSHSPDTIRCEIEADSPIAKRYFPTEYGTIRFYEFLNCMLLPQCKLNTSNYELDSQCSTLVYLRCYGSTIVFTLREHENFFILEVTLNLQLSDYASFVEYMNKRAK